mmetsp:Transcript_70491/g.186009  ORF Transcript_70491/g.186009 Transcript_70491/m.186009 type:complete len:387 (-) Transcript_70491:369-1529(-)
MFKYRIYGQWISGEWQKNYKWQSRAVDPVNTWISMVPDYKIAELWESIVNVVKTKPLSNFIECRMSPTFASLVGIATQEVPQPKLGTASLLPGQAASQDFGSVGVMTDASSYKGDKENTIALQSDSAKGNLAPASKRMLSEGGRALAGAPAGSLAASISYECYSVVTSGGKTVGQLVGDCVIFSPAVALDGSLELCLAKTSTVPVNPAFKEPTMSLKEVKDGKTTFSVLSGVITTKSSGASICAKVKSAGTYCPAARYTDYTSASVVSAKSGCDAIASVSKSIASKSQVLLDAGYTGDGTFLKAGATTSTIAPSEKVKGVVIGGDATTGVAPTSPSLEPSPAPSPSARPPQETTANATPRRAAPPAAVAAAATLCLALATAGWSIA